HTGRQTPGDRQPGSGRGDPDSGHRRRIILGGPLGGLVEPFQGTFRLSHRLLEVSDDSFDVDCYGAVSHQPPPSNLATKYMNWAESESSRRFRSWWTARQAWHTRR